MHKALKEREYQDEVAMETRGEISDERKEQMEKAKKVLALTQHSRDGILYPTGWCMHCIFVFSTMPWYVLASFRSWLGLY